MPEKIAAAAMRQIAVMSALDDLRNTLVASVIGTDYRVVAFMLSKIDAPRQRHNAIHEAGKILIPTDRHLWGQVMGRIRDVEQERNALAHSLWGYAEKTRPTALLLVDARHIGPLRAADYEATLTDPQLLLPRPWAEPPESKPLDRSKVDVYELNYLEEAVNEALKTGLLAQRLKRYLAGGPEAAKERALLCEGLLTGPMIRPPSPIETPPPPPPGWHL